jgi:hypothetical protein
MTSQCSHRCLTTCYHSDKDDVPLVYTRDGFLPCTSPISFYVPRISKDYGELDVIDAFDNMGIGLVTRVDFAPLAPITPGQRESAESIRNPFQKAFVHVDYLYDTDIGHTINDAVVCADNSCRVYPSDNEYWILMNNKMAVPATNLNVHQIAENHRILEQTVMAQAKQIAELIQLLKKLEPKSTF